MSWGIRDAECWGWRERVSLLNRCWCLLGCLRYSFAFSISWDPSPIKVNVNLTNFASQFPGGRPAGSRRTSPREQRNSKSRVASHFDLGRNQHQHLSMGVGCPWKAHIPGEGAICPGLNLPSFSLLFPFSPFILSLRLTSGPTQITNQNWVANAFENSSRFDTYACQYIQKKAKAMNKDG